MAIVLNVGDLGITLVGDGKQITFNVLVRDHPRGCGFETLTTPAEVLALAHALEREVEKLRRAATWGR